jgi:hypothetical protein
MSAIGPKRTSLVAPLTFDRALLATRKRHAHRLANETATNVRNEGRINVRNEAEEQKASDAK